MSETAVASDIGSVIGPLVAVTTEFEKTQPPAVPELCYRHFHIVTLNFMELMLY